MPERKVDTELTPGALLRRSRQRYGWSIDDVADELNLLPQLIESIENDDYEKMAGWTYVVGYLRSYAKLVSINIEEAISTHKNLLPQKEDGPGTLTHRSAARLSIPISFSWIVSVAVVAVVFGGLIATYWQRSNQDDRILVEGRSRSELEKSTAEEGLKLKADLEDEISTSVDATGSAKIEPRETIEATNRNSNVDNVLAPIQLEIAEKKDLVIELEETSEIAEVKQFESILTAMDFDTRIIGLDLTSENKSEQPDSN